MKSQAQELLKEEEELKEKEQQKLENAYKKISEVVSRRVVSCVRRWDQLLYAAGGQPLAKKRHCTI